MLLEPLPKWRRLAIAFGFVIAFLVIVGGIFIWSGFYNVAATQQHFGITNWILQVIRDQSVATQSGFVEPPPVDDPALYRLGAAHYEGGCVVCHGRPGEGPPAIPAHMLPVPPNLVETGRERSPRQVFWIVKHGLKYTGMPAWTSLSRDDEVAAVASFVASLPRGGEEHYRELSGLDRLDAGVGVTSDERIALLQCVRCHDEGGLPTLAVSIPRLTGQNEAYLVRALQEYRDGERPSGIMQPVADLLEDADIRRLAAFYADGGAGRGLAPPPGQNAAPKTDPALVALGAAIAGEGAPQDGIPACLSCHGAGRNPRIPDLAGQHATYLVGQLMLFRSGARAETAWGRIMTAVADQLSDRQILAAAAWFSSLQETPPPPALVGLSDKEGRQ